MGRRIMGNSVLNPAQRPKGRLGKGTMCVFLDTSPQHIFKVAVPPLLAAHHSDMCAILRFSNYTWVHKLYGLSKAIKTPFDECVSVVYVVFSLCDGFVYVGRTDRSLVERLIEHRPEWGNPGTFSLRPA